VQKTIEKNLKEIYPYIKIVGEEDSTGEAYKNVLPTLHPDMLHKDII